MMNDTFDDWLAFRAGEKDRDCLLVCCDCGGEAEGNVSCEDGEICDACHNEATGN